MSDYEAIQRVIIMYSAYLNEGRYDDAANLFSEDGVVLWRTAVTGRPAISDLMRRIREGASQAAAEAGSATDGPVEVGRYQVFAPLVELRSEDAALAWTDLIFLVGSDAGGWRVGACATYYDEFKRHDGVWQIARRSPRSVGGELPVGATERPSA